MTNILSRAPGDAEEAEGDMDVVEEAATSGNATSAKKTRGRKTGTNDFPSKHFASTVPTVDAVFVRPRLTEYLDPKKPSTTNEDMLAAFFGCAIVLDVRAAIEPARPPFFFSPSEPAIFHNFKLFLEALPEHFRPNIRKSAGIEIVDQHLSAQKLVLGRPVSVDWPELRKEFVVLSNTRKRIPQDNHDDLRDSPMKVWNDSLCKECPILFPLDAFFLSIPVGSVEVERLFSRMRAAMDDDQGSLHPETVENRTLVRENKDLLRKNLRNVALDPSIIN